jgi:hypothetical protein
MEERVNVKRVSLFIHVIGGALAAISARLRGDGCMFLQRVELIRLRGEDARLADKVVWGPGHGRPQVADDAAQTSWRVGRRSANLRCYCAVMLLPEATHFFFLINIKCPVNELPPKKKYKTLRRNS